jgi:hypothetical protein
LITEVVRDAHLKYGAIKGEQGFREQVDEGKVLGGMETLVLCF